MEEETEVMLHEDPAEEEEDKTKDSLDGASEEDVSFDAGSEVSQARETAARTCMESTYCKAAIDRMTPSESCRDPY